MPYDASTTERWLAVPEFEGLYEVSDWGRVRSLPRRGTSGRRRMVRLFPSQGRGGPPYWRATLWKSGKRTQIRISRLVLTVFDRPPLSHEEALHQDADRRNNRLTNLRWDTHAVNMAEMRAYHRDLAMRAEHGREAFADDDGLDPVEVSFCEEAPF